MFDKINSAKLNKDIEESLKGLIYRYFNDGDKVNDSRSDPYGYATKYYNELRDLIDDSKEIDDIMYKPKIKYDTKLKILVDYICDAYGKLSTKKIDKGRVTYEFTVLLNNLGLSGIDYSNDENNEKRDEIIDMIVDLAKTMPRL